MLDFPRYFIKKACRKLNMEMLAQSIKLAWKFTEYYHTSTRTRARAHTHTHTHTQTHKHTHKHTHPPGFICIYEGINMNMNSTTTFFISQVTFFEPNRRNFLQNFGDNTNASRSNDTLSFNLYLTHFWPMFLFYTSWKHLKTFDFPVV